MTVEVYLENLNTKMKGGLYSLAVLYMVSSHGPIHGYAILKGLTETSGGRINIRAGTMYPILKVLENNGLVEFRIVPSHEGPPRKVYTTTRKGKEAMVEGMQILGDLITGLQLTMGEDWPRLNVYS